MSRKILFVDGETRALQELKDALAARPHPWELLYAADGLEAIGALNATPCDALVADLRLGDMSGDQLLGQVMKQFPQIHRIMLADADDLQSLLRCVGNVYRLLIKPCDAERLQTVLERSFALDLWMPDHAVRKIIGRMPLLPSPADHHAHVVKELQSPTASAETVGALIAQDPAMTAKVLQLANSAAGSAPPDAADPVQAVKELGLETTQAVLLLSHSYSNFAKLTGTGFSVEALWRHSQDVSRLAAMIARIEGLDEAAVQQSAAAGLLHDLGKLALAANLPDQFMQLPGKLAAAGGLWWKAEREIFGVTHADVGGWLLGIWGLPVPVIEAVALHHRPARFLSSAFGPLAAVHVADAFLRAESLEAATALVDAGYLAEMGLAEKLPRWWENCRTENQPLPN